MKRAGVLLLLTLALPLAQAQVYRWTDAQGRVQIGDRPPAGVDAKLMVDKAQSHKPVDSAAEARKAQEDRDRWQRELLKAQPRVEEGARYRPRPQRPPAAADDCTKARYRFEGARDGRLAYCAHGHCDKVDATDLSLLEREMKEACQRR